MDSIPSQWAMAYQYSQAYQARLRRWLEATVEYIELCVVININALIVHIKQIISTLYTNLIAKAEDGESTQLRVAEEAERRVVSVIEGKKNMLTSTISGRMPTMANACSGFTP